MESGSDAKPSVTLGINAMNAIVVYFKDNTFNWDFGDNIIFAPRRIPRFDYGFSFCYARIRKYHKSERGKKKTKSFSYATGTEPLDFVRNTQTETFANEKRQVPVRAEYGLRNSSFFFFFLNRVREINVSNKINPHFY